MSSQVKINGHLLSKTQIGLMNIEFLFSEMTN